MKSLPVIIIAALGSLCAIGCILLIIVILGASDESNNLFTPMQRFFNRTAATETTAERTKQATEQSRVPEELSDSGAHPATPSFPSPVYSGTYTCGEMVPAGVLTTIITGNNLFCKKSRWSKQWANPKGTGIRVNNRGLLFNDSVVTDTLSGIMWQRYALPEPVALGQLDSVISSMNRIGWQGHSNWRIPTIEELLTLLVPDRNRHGHYLPESWNCRADDIWSCNTACDSLSIRWQWVVRMSLGRCNVGRPDIERSVLAARKL